MALNECTECLKKQREIDRLTEELQSLRQQLRYQERQATEGFFGSATPSAKLPVKTNTPPPPAPKPKGARPGHPGARRQAFDARHAERVGLDLVTFQDHPYQRRFLDTWTLLSYVAGRTERVRRSLARRRR